MADKIYRFLYTGFYTGYSPYAPGTAGTLAALVLYLILFLAAGNSVVQINMVLTIVLIAPAAFLCGKGEKHFGKKDPSQVVIDEIIGYMVTLFFIPFSYPAAVFAFILFRFFDILKPWPIRKIESIGGGIGILADDVVAGIFANISLRAVLYLLSITGILQ